MTINTLETPSGQEDAEPTRADDARSARPTYRFTGQPPNALSGLLASPRWVGWDYHLRDGRWTKPPLNPRNGGLAKVNEPHTWGTFDDAVARMEKSGNAGVGLVLTDDIDITGIDLDDCINDSGSLSDLAAEIVALGETYAEISPSGEGIRLFAQGVVDRAVKDDALGIEVYSRGRFLTVTGNHIPDTPDEIRAAPRTLALLRAAVEANRCAETQPNANGHHHAGAGDFFGNINSVALGRLDEWVPMLHPTAKKQPNGAWRVTSQELGRRLEEDLSYHPQGIRDHGEEHGLSPIDAVQRYGDAADAKAAAMWLCQVLGIEPSRLGWKGTPTNVAPHSQSASPKKATPDPHADPAHWHVDPWPDEISGARVLDGICEVLRRYMVLREHAAEAISLWVLHAWTIEAYEISPILIIVSPTKQCGKSTLMTLIYWITPRSELVSNVTASPIFRLIEDARPDVPTFLLDEGDSYLKPDKEDLRGILNSGWMRAGARVLRTEGDGNQRRARRFSTWAPKVIATIKTVADTLMDRAVVIMLSRKAKGEKAERFRMRDTPEFAALRQQASRWANDNVVALRDADPDVPFALHNRAADNWRALIAVADAAGGDWPERARAAAVALTGAKGDDDRGVLLLRDIRRVFEDGGQGWLGAEVLVNALVALPETPWAEWRRGEKPITSRGVATILADFGIKSDDDHRPRRYWREDFEAAWAAYLAIDADPSGGSG
ncbi:MAG: DUF3631 domain-containing protein [Hyphomicrobiaceae bacterium]